MPFSDMPLNKEVFERIRWEETIGESEEKECQPYSGLFFSKAKGAEEANDEEAQEAFAVLGGMTSMMLNADSREEPFSPMMVLPTGRSAALEDFTDNHMDALKEAVAEATDPHVPPLPPHIGFDQAVAFTRAIYRGNPDAQSIIARAFADMTEDFIPHR